MRRNDGPSTPRREAPANPPSPPETPPADTTTLLGDLVIPGTIAVAAGGIILATAITWGAAEAAVGVGAAYLVYSAITGRGDLSGTLAVRLLTGVLRRLPAETEAGPGVE